MPTAARLEVRGKDKSTLRSWVRASGIRAGLAQRARIVLLAAEGLLEHGDRDAGRGVAADGDRLAGPLRRGRAARAARTASGRVGRGDRRGRGRGGDADRRRRQRLGVTHWSSRLLAARAGDRASRRWRGSGASWNLQPWRVETFKFSTDPELDAKVRDVVGLYLNPPEKAVVLCIDEKSQVQALDRTAPILPLRPGLPEKADPRLRPQRHHHAVRRPGGGHRQGHRRLPAPAPPPGVPALPQAGRQGLPAAASCTSSATTTPPTSTPP